MASAPNPSALSSHYYKCHRAFDIFAKLANKTVDREADKMLPTMFGVAIFLAELDGFFPKSLCLDWRKTKKKPKKIFKLFADFLNYFFWELIRKTVQFKVSSNKSPQIATVTSRFVVKKYTNFFE